MGSFWAVLREVILVQKLKTVVLLELVVGLEPTACALRVRCSASELHQHMAVSMQVIFIITQCLRNVNKTSKWG